MGDANIFTTASLRGVKKNMKEWQTCLFLDGIIRRAKKGVEIYDVLPSPLNKDLFYYAYDFAYTNGSESAKNECPEFAVHALLDSTILNKYKLPISNLFLDSDEKYIAETPDTRVVIVNKCVGCSLRTLLSSSQVIDGNQDRTRREVEKQFKAHSCSLRSEVRMVERSPIVAYEDETCNCHGSDNCLAAIKMYPNSVGDAGEGKRDIMLLCCSGNPKMRFFCIPPIVLTSFIESRTRERMKSSFAERVVKSDMLSTLVHLTRKQSGGDAGPRGIQKCLRERYGVEAHRVLTRESIEQVMDNIYKFSVWLQRMREKYWPSAEGEEEDSQGLEFFLTNCDYKIPAIVMYAAILDSSSEIEQAIDICKGKRTKDNKCKTLKVNIRFNGRDGNAFRFALQSIAFTDVNGMRFTIHRRDVTGSDDLASVPTRGIDSISQLDIDTGRATDFYFVPLNMSEHPRRSTRYSSTFSAGEEEEEEDEEDEKDDEEVLPWYRGGNVQEVVVEEPYPPKPTLDMSGHFSDDSDDREMTANYRDNMKYERKVRDILENISFDGYTLGLGMYGIVYWKVNGEQDRERTFLDEKDPVYICGEDGEKMLVIDERKAYLCDENGERVIPKPGYFRDHDEYPYSDSESDS